MQQMDTARAIKALLDWQAELGADTALGDLPVDRYAVPPPAKPAPPVVAAPAVMPAEDDPVARAAALAAAAPDLATLRTAMDGFDGCDLKHGARTLVFSDGVPGARVMILGEAPGRDEDMAGKPFVGRAGQLLDQMLAAIGLSRAAPDPGAAVYISNLIPWRPPQNRKPTAQELAMMAPFARRHLALADPDYLVLMGNSACEGLLGLSGITRLRGQWTELAGLPCLPMLHPAYLLRNPAAKREAWADLLALRARLHPDETTP